MWLKLECGCVILRRTEDSAAEGEGGYSSPGPTGYSGRERQGREEEDVHCQQKVSSHNTLRLGSQYIALARCTVCGVTGQCDIL